MATLVNMIILLFILALTLNLGYLSPQLSNTGMGLVANSTLGNLTASTNGLSTSVNGALSSPGLGTLFVNIFGVFANTFGIIASLIVAPAALFAALDIPREISFFLGTLFTITMGYLVITWYKGQTV